MSTVYFTADLHFGHANIIGYCDRPYADVDEMNEALVDNWNTAVGRDDTVFVLGDFAMGKIDDTLPIAGRLNGRKILVPGNHDRCWLDLAKPEQGKEMTKVAHWRQRYLAAGFEHITQPTIWLDDLGVTDVSLKACHFPYVPTDDRHHSSHPTPSPAWLLHGHVHDLWKTNGRQINVGVDVWDYRPVALDQILDIITETP